MFEFDGPVKAVFDRCYFKNCDPPILRNGAKAIVRNSLFNQCGPMEAGGSLSMSGVKFALPRHHAIEATVGDLQVIIGKHALLVEVEQIEK